MLVSRLADVVIVISSDASDLSCLTFTADFQLTRIFSWIEYRFAFFTVGSDKEMMC